MQIILNTKVSRLVSYALLSSAIVLSASCSDDAEEAQPAKTAATQQSAMDVKQPTVVEEAPKAALQTAPAPVVEEKVEEAKKVVEEQAAEVVAVSSGEKAYATCVGCHGSKAEGGLGPRLNNQKPEELIAKLERYKAGEQLGPMTGMMAPMAAGLTADDMKAVAEYVVTLK